MIEGIKARRLDKYGDEGFTPVWFKFNGKLEAYTDTHELYESDVDSYRDEIWKTVGPKCLIVW